MPSLNKLMIMGHLGRDPETKYLPSGDPVSSFSVAVGEKYKDQEHTEWFNCTAFGKLADVAKNYLHKGSPVFIEGKIKTREYDGKDGQRKKFTEVIVGNIQMLGSKQQRSEDEDLADGSGIPF